MAAGHHGNTGIGGRGGRWGCIVHNRNKLAAHLAAAQARESRVLLPPARSTTTGNPTDSGGRWSVGFSARLQEHFPDRRALPGRRQGSRREQGDARQGDTRHDTRSTVTVGGGADVSDIPEFVSEQGGACMPRQHARHALAGVEVQDFLEGTRALPNRATLWNVDLIDLADRKGTRALEVMERDTLDGMQGEP